MNKLTVTKIFSIIVIVIGIMVTFGWIFDIASLKSILPNYVTMKFSTSVSFIFSGVTLYFISRFKEGKSAIAQIAIPASGLVIALFMVTNLISSFLPFQTGLENIFVKETGNAISTTIPGKPSIGTMVNFIFIIVYGIFSMSDSIRLRKFAFGVGYFVIGVGLVSLVGYITNLPLLYYASPGVSTAMALHTSVLFVILGSGMILLRSYYQEIGTESLSMKKKLMSLFLIISMTPIIFLGVLSYGITKEMVSADAFEISLLILTATSAIIVGIFSISISKSIVNPILKIRHVVSQVSKGDLDVKADERSTDELGDLAKDFNQMTTSIKLNEAMKIQNEKMVAIGNTASRLAHDIRNPLSVILNGIELLKMYEKNMDEVKLRSYARLENAIHQITAQIEDVMDFVRQSPLELAKHSLLDILKNTVGIIVIPNTVKIEFPKNDAIIICDQLRISNVFSNLILNAIQAMNDNGTIKIRITDDENKSVIEFEDTGPGISDEILPKIFDPLFTTKAKGTGLGLATCQSIIKQHGGTILVNPKPTIFTISFFKNKPTL
ncbi:sensor histidine kinase [Candidatus Nitrosotalea bavarica]|uniref:sensor histidine kinase n=1 Tax=Candidatus Nitrosotalea bavarica TaxID=1903277 RepID=UPI0013FD9956|nr:HAMP domain-containing sensor histidine kinase [Candidatus Nitrosotalea bavarica]